jgi:hypothetical protein
MCEITTKAFNLLSSLSFDQYVLIDCLKFGRTIDLITESVNNIYLREYVFVALTNQGFLNIFNEILTLLKEIKDDYYLKLYDNQIMFSQNKFIISIKYTTVDITTLINLPGLDFYKCYYDGVKLHITPEADRCWRTGNVQYLGKIGLEPWTVNNIINYSHLRFKEGFWKLNREYVIFPSDVPVKFNYSILRQPLNRYFPTKFNVNQESERFGLEYMCILSNSDFEEYAKRIYNFIDLQETK